MAKLTGAEKVKAKLKRLNGRAVKQRISAAIYTAADMLRVEAALSISTGAVSGKNHVPSRPGEPPNYDTGDLADKIEVRKIDEFECEVVASSGHAAPLEFGTSKMAERPFMRPAAKKTRKQAHRLVAIAIAREGMK